MKDFVSNLSTKIFFGPSHMSKISAEIKNYGKRVLLLYGFGSIKKSGLHKFITDQLKNENIFYTELSGVEPNPDISTVRKAVEIIKQNDLDFILAVGGGSVIDCSKAIATAVFYNGDPWDFLEYKVKPEKALPIGSVLTLSATGSEMNGGSVISNRELKLKRAFSSEIMKPVFSFLNPELTYSVSKYQTAAGSVDIFVHVAEQYFSSIENTFLQNRIAESVFNTVIEYAQIAIDEPENYNARANLMWASTIGLNGLLGFGKIGDWSTHMIEHELSAVYDITHGAGLAVILPNWMRYVLNEDNKSIFCEYGRNVFDLEGDDIDIANIAIDRTQQFFKLLGMPTTLKELNIDSSMFDFMAENTVKFGKIGNFVKLGKEDVLAILVNSL
ncbi:MAG: iron-containing alcohol dehydrogenase [Candidatus Delongbacteria bacterium]|nr:iron-containing alcohol dehydrogenase [Candidatus Delongbacteria bacterium]MBN2835040.1 iron-containing alcohol dehydrogenase [Candidatus Delongbacteria bacterium]